MREKTLSYYNTKAEEFIEHTRYVDFTETQNRFLARVPAGAYILDFGCGSGRDTKYFLEHGCRVEAIDGSEELCRSASAYTGIPVRHMYFQDLQAQETYDAVWACSSILHLPYGELVEVMKKMAAAVKEQGVVYTSFKYGTFEGERNGRYFTDLDEDGMKKLLQKVPELELEEYWITSDVRPGRGEEKWLNLFLRKKS